MFIDRRALKPEVYHTDVVCVSFVPQVAKTGREAPA